MVYVFGAKSNIAQCCKWQCELSILSVSSPYIVVAGHL